MKKETFAVIENHLKLLKHIKFEYDDDDIDFGAAALNVKQSYGSGSVYEDIAKIIGIKPKELYVWGDSGFSNEQKREIKELHKGMTTVLTILARHGKIKIGVYRRRASYSSNWDYIGRLIK